MVRSHVEANWSNYRERILRFEPGRSRSFALESVENLDCQPYFGAADCDFDVVTRLADGGLEPIRMSSQFEMNDDGSLTEVIVMVHELRR